MAVRIETKAEPIPGYRLLERIGGGGFGEVWKAEAPGGLHKAIKFVFGDLETTGDEGMRAEQELKALSRVKTVRHPYILSLERFDIIDGQLMIVMELADRNLWDRFRECRSQGLPGIPRDELLGYMEESAEALDLMNNDYQLQHLDIKPQNLFLVHNHVKVADFGLVKDLEGMAASVTGGVTPVYAAPETFDGWVSRFSDQYSLAIVYQELLTGQRPFSGTNVRQLILQHLQGIPNLTSLPLTDQPIIARALAKNPDERFPRCAEMVQRLREAGRGPAAGAPTGEAPAGEGHTTAQVTVRSAAPAAPEAPAATPVPPAAQPVFPSPPRRPTAKAEAIGPEIKTRWVKAQPEPQPEPPPVTEAPPKPPLVEGDGILFPALVIGVGELGLHVLQHLRQDLNEQFGSSNALPNIRLLGIDTDPESARSSSRRRVALPPEEMLLARLGRPSHYLKARKTFSDLDSWFEPKMLYRIPRNPVTTGLRALGRLAFMDNYPSISSRLRNELEACADLDALTAAARQTKLGLRTSRPRVYVVCSLAGGTGSGMFLDVAYVVRKMLRNLGYERPEVVGLFLLPPADPQPGRTIALGNAFAALTELNHFSTGGTPFTARYREREPALHDPEPPFVRWTVWPIPGTKDAASVEALTGLVGQALHRELVTPMGRTLDEERAGVAVPQSRSPRAYCQSVGLVRLSWPRAALANRVARQLCQKVVQRWISKDSEPVKEPVRAWVADLWANQDLGADSLIAELQEACAKALKCTPEAAFNAVVEPFGPGSETKPGFLAGLSDGLKEIERLVGRPDSMTVESTGVLAETLASAAARLTTQRGQRLADMAVRLMERPEFRLAGAEEAMRQVIGGMEQILQSYEPLSKEMAGRSAEAYSRLKTILTSPSAAAGARKKETVLANLPDLLRSYGKWRYQSLMIYRVMAAFVSLRGYLSDQLREMNYCRARLTDLAKSFQTQPAAEPGEAAAAHGRQFFPSGCQTLEEAADQLLAGVTPEGLQDLDRRIQDLVQRQFQALVQVCLASANVIKSVEAAMLQEAEAFVAGRLVGADVAEMYLANCAGDDAAREALAADFKGAEPVIHGTPPYQGEELSVLTVPEGSAGERLARFAREALPDEDLVTLTTGDDIVFYREFPLVPLASLEQLGPAGYEAYRQMTNVEHFTPHTRIDITEWRAATV
jgi:eukaryotic-like serine/threonine-protein kinase